MESIFRGIAPHEHADVTNVMNGHRMEDGTTAIWCAGCGDEITRVPAPISSQAGLASIRGGLPLATLHAVTARNVAAGNVIVEQPAGHAHTAAYQGLCTGECGV